MALAFCAVWLMGHETVLRHSPWASWASGMALFSRLDGDKVLEHPTRRRVLETVSARPGLTLQGLQALLGVAWGTMVHHVHVLQRHGQLVSVRQGPRRLLYESKTPHARARGHLALLHHATARAIAEAVRASPGIRQSEVGQRVGVQGPAVSKHLARLTQAGLVVVERQGQNRRYLPTAKLLEAFAIRSCDPGARSQRPPRPSLDGPSCRNGKATPDPEGDLGGLRTPGQGQGLMAPTPRAAVGSLL